MVFLAVLIYVFISLIVGTGFMLVSVDPSYLKVAFSFINDTLLVDIFYRVGLFLVGFLVIYFCFKYLEAVFVRPRKDKSITFSLNHGKVSITLFAIEDMLKKMLEEKPELSHIRPKVISHKKGVEVIVRSDLTSEVNLIEFTQEVQERVREKLRYLLGDEKDITVKVEIRKMVFGSKGGPGEAAPAIPFRNY